ncbi:MAG: response regulator transcription factor [Betaproteobacteria bacterium]|nr:response regulator transcription factor [Betaproteobacteria bacterium]
MRLGVLLADDHKLVRAGLKALVGGFSGFAVIGECGDGREAVRMTRDLDPAIVLMDLSMPGLNGLDATARITRESPQTRVIVLSMHTAENYVREAFRVGALGYVIKDDAVHDLEDALRHAALGHRFLSPALSATLGPERLAQIAVNDGNGRDGEPLTSRQREILQLIAEGRSTRDIAERLSISVKTVETHRAQVMERLGIRDVAGLTRYAMRLGLVGPDC